MNYLQPDRLDALAQEFALGTLRGPARRRFLKLLQQSPAARVAVGVWQERLTALETGAPQVAPRRNPGTNQALTFLSGHCVKLW
jgi:anti-sigma-K factor RskA